MLLSLWNNTKISVLFPYAAPTRKCTPKRDRKNKGTTTRAKSLDLVYNIPRWLYCVVHRGKR